MRIRNAFLYTPGMVPHVRWLLVVVLLFGAADARESYDEILKRYNILVKRKTLRKRTLGRQLLADTEDDRALDILIRDYAKPGKPALQTRYLIAHMVGDVFAEEKHADKFVTWRGRHGKPVDAWLWYRTLLAHHENKGPDDLIDLAKSRSDLFLRCTAIEVLRLRFDPAMMKLIVELVNKLPEKPLDRAILIESMTAALCNLHEYKAKPAFRAPAEALIKQMERPTMSKRTKIVMGRYFARLFKTNYVWTNPARWLAELNFVQSGGKTATQKGYDEKKPTFAGIEANGDRICYVIDMSDSMLTPLSPKELEKLPRGPITGKTAKRRASKSDAWKKAFKAVDWSKVKTRFDAARELLKTSLLGLEEHQYFCVIWFGDKSAALSATRGLVSATAGNVKKVFAELDGLRAGSATATREHGTLKGNTNMHGGMHRAFKLKGKGAVGPGEYVNRSTWKGCDVIFLLSDGDPSWDDWAGTDQRDPWDSVGDPETGVRTNQEASTLNFPGPYARSNYLVTDVTRLNLFRKVEIHAIGMGEANMSTLQRIAAIGIGQAVNLKGQ